MTRGNSGLYLGFMACVLITAGPWTVFGQPPPDDSAYQAVVEKYRGRDAGAIDNIAALTERDLLNMFGRVADLEWPPESLVAEARAVSIVPRFPEAAPHLGRIRLIQRRHEEAARWLAVASTSDSVPTRYLAALFRGALAERRGQYDDAETHYRVALEVFRWAARHRAFRRGFRTARQRRRAVHRLGDGR